MVGGRGHPRRISATPPHQQAIVGNERSVVWLDAREIMIVQTRSREETGPIGRAIAFGDLPSSDSSQFDQSPRRIEYDRGVAVQFGGWISFRDNVKQVGGDEVTRALPVNKLKGQGSGALATRLEPVFMVPFSRTSLLALQDLSRTLGERFR